MMATGSLCVPTEPHVQAVQRSDALIELELSLPPSLLYFEGHFDGFPILPGVVQLHWALRFARLHLPVGRRLPVEMQIKFRRPIRPEARLVLALSFKEVPDRKQVTFAYRCDDVPCSSGKIILGEP
jgi:3-hydroxymyristoyl/3-hydroxydecanoyl-(acyl carrier protein) dehydratase